MRRTGTATIMRITAINDTRMRITAVITQE